jgi:hypothetical protein
MVDNMQHYLVVLDDSAAAWQTAYTAYDVAARSGSTLLGVVVEGQPNGTLVRQKFETGARAAGIRATAHSIPSLSGDSFRALLLQAIAVFISQATLTDPELLNNLLRELTCPLWIIPEQRTIRRVMIATTTGAATAPEVELGLSLMRRWGVLLEILVTSDSLERLNRNEILDDEVSQRVVPELTLSTFLKRADDDEIDLTVLSWPNEVISVWEACRRTHCLLAVCPVLNSH